MGADDRSLVRIVQRRLFPCPVLVFVPVQGKEIFPQTTIVEHLEPPALEWGLPLIFLYLYRVLFSSVYPSFFPLRLYLTSTKRAEVTTKGEFILTTLLLTFSPLPYFIPAVSFLLLSTLRPPPISSPFPSYHLSSLLSLLSSLLSSLPPPHLSPPLLLYLCCPLTFPLRSYLLSPLLTPVL